MRSRSERSGESDALIDRFGKIIRDGMAMRSHKPEHGRGDRFGTPKLPSMIGKLARVG
jgi:hypothetical protein